MTDKPSRFSLPAFIADRPDEYKGVMSPAKFDEFISGLNPQFLVDENGNNLQISEFFGNLQFVYNKNIEDLYKVNEDGTSVSPDITKLIELNPTDYPISSIFLGFKLMSLEILSAVSLPTSIQTLKCLLRSFAQVQNANGNDFSNLNPFFPQ